MSDSTRTAVATAALVSVPVTTMWIAPDSPRTVDAPITADSPDAERWLAGLDARPEDDESGDGRLGLHGRIESQLVAGEPVRVVGADESGRWSRVVAPWQLSPKDDAGYPGWVPTAHLSPVAAGESPATESVAGAPVATVDAATLDAEHPALALAREHLGLLYLWGGLTPLGLDCSGLVHHTWRRFGIVVPRDAYAQAEFAEPVALDAVAPGDLYFFARPGRRIHHVGIVVRPGRMVHASETGGVLVEEDLTADRIDTLVVAGRLPRP
ncbi:C40 family peptidase [Intrasporangium oryzae]|uniref:C40 family peptidase n=1 Tax=Intrasporangium oryzae TaxID=412687 RepID=UPI0004AC96D0|nr:NlpC/P60 family protein [Intrasporangium oryzae]